MSLKSNENHTLLFEISLIDDNCIFIRQSISYELNPDI